MSVWDEGVIEDFHREGFWDSTTLAGRVVEHAVTHPSAPAFIDADGERMCWSDYESRSAQLAYVLTELAAVHDPVAILLPDRPVVHVAYLAAERAGNVAVAIGPRAGMREIAHLLAVTGAQVLVSGSQHLDEETTEVTRRLEAELGRRLRHVVVDQGPSRLDIAVDGAAVSVPILDECRDSIAGRGLGPDELFFINSTSGTTGRPKCVMHTQNRWKYFHSRARHFRPDDVFMVVVPAPFGFGLWMGHFTPTLLGAPTVMTHAFDPGRTLEVAEREGVTILAAVSSQVVMMLASERIGATDLSALRVVQTGGERVAFDKAAQFEDVTGAMILQFYGSNEAGCVSGTTPDDPRDKRLRTAGRALPEMRMRLFDEAGTDITATGGPGQCGCRGPAISPGYFGSPEANLKLFRQDGWMLLGDIVELDAEGYVTVQGRTADFIIRGGQNISAAALEEDIGRHPRVAIAAVVAVADELLGERVCAFVVTKDQKELPLDQLTLFLEAEGVSKQSWPEAIITVPSLPEGPGGKVAKAGLKADAEQRQRTGQLEMRQRPRTGGT
ncbi:MAG TPA: class I adenylate-forming enzyme family protein [Acidimicrobiales bacterium]